ncbi:hypothetical protein IWQ56_003774 [Coemansia nantahalensis]|nr:hypothetical protein IWQ56_003774 [Coemansia nantahalensis]
MSVIESAWAAFSWLARVTVLPARFIYLLFLERPFAAAVSLFLWVLPLLSFVIVLTVIGIVLGGTFGWISATLAGLFQELASGNGDDDNDNGGSDGSGETAASAPGTAASLTRRRAR